jgi:hypothetical protein
MLRRLLMTGLLCAVAAVCVAGCGDSAPTAPPPENQKPQTPPAPPKIPMPPK